MFKKIFLIVFFSLLAYLNLHAQKATLSGTITANSSNESLIGVSVYIPTLNRGAVTNQYGYYSLTVPPGTYQVMYSYIGFSTQYLEMELKTDVVKNIVMAESAQNLSEILIEGEQKQISVSKPEMSVNKLSIKTIKDLPVVLGEVDIIKSLLQLPGVTSAGEGASGFNVRGGAADQNLILLDEATLFSSSHLFGLFSIFNPDAVKDLKLYKGGVPARYGGRISSVLDIYQREGNSKEFHAQGGIGLLSSRLLIEGPIKKERTSFLAGGRSSYAHVFFPLFDIDNRAFFYDLNLKINHTINENNKLFLSSYFGKDVFELEDQFFNAYGNQFVNLRWNHLFSNKLFSNASIIYSNYFYDLNLDFIGFNWTSGITNLNFKYDFVHYLNNDGKLRFGTNQLLYEFNPGKIEPSEPGSNFITSQLTKKYAYESGYYFETEFKASEKLTLSGGLRLSSFFRLGQRTFNLYQNNQPVVFNTDIGIYEEAEISATRSLSRRKVHRRFFNLEPRLNAVFELNDENSIKASYQRTTQYIHLISNTSSPTPLDIWEPSGRFVKPQLSNQVAAGYFKEFDDSTYSLSLEAYYKTIKNRVNYIDGAQLIANSAIERVLLNGRGRAYGLEFLLQKSRGKFRGWLAYTLSRTEQQIKGRTPEEPGLNNGKWFVNNFDKTHDISLNGSFKLNKKWKLNAAFNFQTGIPTTFPVAQYEYNGIVVPEFGERNSNRLPNYHRIDISASYTRKPESKKKWKSEWVFGVYNIYNRKNATSITFAQNEETGVNEATRLAIFGIVPSITYNFKF